MINFKENLLRYKKPREKNAAFARRIGVTKAALYFLSKTNNPRLSTIRKYAKLLGIDATALLFNECDYLSCWKADFDYKKQVDRTLGTGSSVYNKKLFIDNYTALAQRLGITRQAVSIALKRNNPNMKSIRNTCDALGISLLEFVNE